MPATAALPTRHRAAVRPSNGAASSSTTVGSTSKASSVAPTRARASRNLDSSARRSVTTSVPVARGWRFGVGDAERIVLEAVVQRGPRVVVADLFEGGVHRPYEVA